MMLSGNSFGPRAMDENSSALAAGPPRKSGGLRPQSNADDVRKQPLGGAAKPKTRRALGDLSSSQVNSRQVEKGVAGKPGAAFKIVGPSSKKESFQLFDGGTAAKTQSPAASAGTYYDEADFICSRGVTKPRDPADIVHQMSMNVVHKMERPTLFPKKYNTKVFEVPDFPDHTSTSGADILDLLDGPSASMPPVDFDLDLSNAEW